MTRPQLRRSTRREYELIDHGFLDDDNPIELLDRMLEVYREPARPRPARRRCGYAAVETLRGGATITPVGAPTAAVEVSDLLP